MTANKGTDDHAGDEPRASTKDQAKAASTKQQAQTAQASQQGDAGNKSTSSAAAGAATANTGSDKQPPQAGAEADGGPAHAGQGKAGGEQASANKASADKTNASKVRGKTRGDKTGENKSAAGKNTAASAQQKSPADKAQTAQQPAADKTTAKTAAAKTGAQNSQSKPAQSGAGAGGSGRAGGGGNGSAGKDSKLPVIVAIIALVVAVIALVVAAWMWQQNQHNSKQLGSRIANVQGNLQASVKNMVTAPLEQMDSRIKTATGTANAAKKAGQKQAQTVAQLHSQLQQTRLQLNSVQQKLEGNARQWWQLEQIENLLTVANRRLQLYEEPGQASSALELASRMLARINDPRLFKVRKDIVNNIAALDALPSPDTEGMALKLSAFIDQVRDLPLVSDMPQNYTSQQAGGGNSDADANVDTDAQDGIDWAGGWHRFVNSVGNAVQSMATLRRADGSQPALLPPDQVYFLTQNLMLELRAARLALLEGDTTLYRNSLTSATAWLQQYFDTSDTAVQAMLKGLKQLQNVKLEWQTPDISSSLRALHEYMHTVSQEDKADKASEANAQGNE